MLVQKSQRHSGQMLSLTPILVETHNHNTFNALKWTQQSMIRKKPSVLRQKFSISNPKDKIRDGKTVLINYIKLLLLSELRQSQMNPLISWTLTKIQT